MDSYTAFSKIYDELMDNIPYDEWVGFITLLFKEDGIKKGSIICELGCGTGKVTNLLAKEGYDMIGIDNSIDMLDEAREKTDSDLSVLYLNQDMREFELYGTVKAVISICDCINYITDREELLTVFKLVNNYLDPSGLFIFDINTNTKYKSIGDVTIAEDRDDCAFIWDNYYEEEEKINVYDLSLFLKGEDGRYDKYEEQHIQKAYSVSEIKELLNQAGLEFVAAYDGFTKKAANEKSERICFVAREMGKEKV